MKNFFIITPTFNDWRSLNKVLHEIDKKVSKMKGAGQDLEEVI